MQRLKKAKMRSIVWQMGEGEGDKAAIKEEVGPTKLGCVEMADLLGVGVGTIGVVVFGGIEVINKAAKAEIPLLVSFGLLVVSGIAAMGIDLYKTMR
jgi:hypothetical protein